MKKTSFTDHSNSSMNFFCKNIRRYQPLSRSEELDLIIAAQAGDARAKEKLVKHNTAFVLSLAKEMETPFVGAMDLVGDGVSGLMEAIDKIDTRRGNKLITVAKPYIMKRITETLSQDRLVHIPDDEVRKMRKGKVENIEMVYYQDEESHCDLENNASYSAEMGDDQADIMDEIYAVVGTMAPKKASIFRELYGRNDGFEHAPEIVADINHCSRERVRQVNKEVISALRQHLGVDHAA